MRFTLIFLRLVCQPNYNAEFNWDKHINTFDATRISYMYVLIILNTVEHKSHTYPSTGPRQGRRGV